jgi:hypothetical protein
MIVVLFYCVLFLLAAVSILRLIASILLKNVLAILCTEDEAIMFLVYKILHNDDKERSIKDLQEILFFRAMSVRLLNVRRYYTIVLKNSNIQWRNAYIVDIVKLAYFWQKQNYLESVNRRNNDEKYCVDQRFDYLPNGCFNQASGFLYSN